MSDKLTIGRIEFGHNLKHDPIYDKMQIGDTVTFKKSETTPTPLNRQELREAVALSIANTQRKRVGLKMMTAAEIKGIDPIGWERVDEEANAAIKAYEEFSNGNK